MTRQPNMSIFKNIQIFSSTKFTPEQVLPLEDYLSRMSWNLVLASKKC